MLTKNTKSYIIFGFIHYRCRRNISCNKHWW